MTNNKQGFLILLGVSMWVSFILAGIATMLFFATFDPVEISQIATFPMQLDRLSGYSIGFLLFWFLLVVNALFVSWMSNPKK